MTRTLPIALTLGLLAGCGGSPQDPPLVKPLAGWGLAFAIVFFAAIAVMILRLARRIPPDDVDPDEMMREGRLQWGHPFGMSGAPQPRLHTRLWWRVRRRKKKAKSESDWSRF
jgi:hypothetical protein